MNKTAPITKQPDPKPKPETAELVEPPKQIPALRAGAGRRAVVDGSSERPTVVNIYETSQ